MGNGIIKCDCPLIADRYDGRTRKSISQVVGVCANSATRFYVINENLVPRCKEHQNCIVSGSPELSYECALRYRVIHEVMKS